MSRFSGITWLLFGLTTLAVAGVVHIVSVLALPYRAPDDAFQRVASLAPSNRMVRLAETGFDADRIPFRDPVMGEALCRYDLRTGPLRVAVGPFDRGFLSIGFHSRHGIAFYGLTIRSADATAFALVLQPPDFKAADLSDDDGRAPNRDILVKAPEREGFITVQTPMGDGVDANSVADNLSHVTCAPDAPEAR